eukprot:TRINITY_DN2097_c1_g1_i1.p1 TRINITY_DN2097_c1_g1~~TRINITY_DN2097_c1_g1_i1.p1  ORF type:complete len:2118 (+),score=544.53 TRINITY_DN2097_c1_g1_i1:121-6474(+)
MRRMKAAAAAATAAGTSSGSQAPTVQQSATVPPTSVGGSSSDAGSDDGQAHAFKQSPKRGPRRMARIAASAPGGDDGAPPGGGDEETELLLPVPRDEAQDEALVAVALAASVVCSLEPVRERARLRTCPPVEILPSAPVHTPWYVYAYSGLADRLKVQRCGLAVVHRIAPGARDSAPVSPARSRRGALRESHRHEAGGPLGTGPVDPLLVPVMRPCCAAVEGPVEMVVERVSDEADRRFCVDKFYASGALLVARGLMKQANRMRHVLASVPPVRQPPEDTGDAARIGRSSSFTMPLLRLPSDVGGPPPEGAAEAAPPPGEEGSDAQGLGATPVREESSNAAPAADVVDDHRETRAVPPPPPPPGSVVQIQVDEPAGSAAVWMGGGLCDDLLLPPAAFGRVSVGPPPEERFTRPRLLSTARAAAAATTAALFAAVLGAPLDAFARAAGCCVPAPWALAASAAVRSDVWNWGDATARRMAYEAERLLSVGFSGEGLKCCYPLDYLLEGADGVYERRVPPMAKHLASSVEQRLLWRAIHRPADEEEGPAAHGRLSIVGKSAKPQGQHYVSCGPNGTGLLLRHLDPLEDRVAGPYEFEKVCKGYKSWDQVLVRYPPTKGEVGKLAGGAADYEFDVFLREVAFHLHPSFNNAAGAASESRRLASTLAHLQRSYDALQRPTPEQGAEGAGDHPLKAPMLQLSRLPRAAGERRVQGLLTHLSRVCSGGACGPAARETALRWRAGALAREVASGPPPDLLLDGSAQLTPAGARALSAWLLWLSDKANAGADPEARTQLWDADTDKQPRARRGGAGPALQGLGVRAGQALMQWAAGERRRLAVERAFRREQRQRDAEEHGEQQSVSSSLDPLLDSSTGGGVWGRVAEGQIECIDADCVRALAAVLRPVCPASRASSVGDGTAGDLAQYGPMSSMTLGDFTQVANEPPGADADLADLAPWVAGRLLARVAADSGEMRQYWDGIMPELQAAMEAELGRSALAGSPLEDLKARVAEARRLLSDAEARELGVLREMLQLWHELKAIPSYQMHIGPAKLLFVERTCMGRDDLAEIPARATDRELLQRVPVWQAPQPPKPFAGQGPLGGWRYRCRLNVKAGGQVVGVFETEERELSADSRVVVNEAARLYIPQEPEAVIVDVLQCGAYKRSSVGFAVLRPPFGRSPHEQSHPPKPQSWYKLESAAAGNAGVVIADAYWSQHDTARPSRAPRPPPGHAATAELHEVRAMVRRGCFDPVDPVNRPTIRRLAERYGATGAGIGAIAPPLDGVGPVADDAAELADAARARRARRALRRELLRRRWQLQCDPHLDVVGRDALLVGRDAVGIPFSPKQRDWGADRYRADEVTGEVPAAERKGGPCTVADWSERIRRDRAALRRPRRTDADTLHQLVPQPPPIDLEGESCLDWLSRFLQPISKLAPPRPLKEEDSTSQRGRWEGLQRASIQVHVARAMNLPRRTSEHLAPPGAAGCEGDPKESGERVLVEVAFRGSPCKQHTQQVLARPTAAFSETLHLDFVPPGDEQPASKKLSEETLACITDPIEFNVFDWVRTDQDVTTSISGKEIRAREDRRFIGRCSLPFYTLYHSYGGMWEGSLEIEMPALSLAYARPDDDLARKGETVVSKPPTLSLQISLDPAVYAIPSPPCLPPEGSEEELQHFQLARRWENRCRSIVQGLSEVSSGPEMRATRVVALAPGAGQRAVLVTRFVAELGLPPPPSCLGDPDGAAEASPMWACAHYVALIPFSFDVVAHADRQRDVWHTSAEFLRHGRGDYEEHAVLLANYFRWLGRAELAPFKEVRLVTGRAVRHDEAVYVWTETRGEPSCSWLWDPVAGRRYLFDDCPLRDVSIVFDNTNVWCNIQPGTRPRDIFWDLANGSCWEALFGTRSARGLLCPKGSVHDNELEWEGSGERLYTAPDIDRARELEQELGVWVKERLREMRRPDRRLLTRFHRYVGAGGERAMDDLLLPALEEALRAGLEAGRVEPLPNAQLPRSLRCGDDVDAVSSLRQAVLRTVQEIMFSSTASPADYYQVGVPLHVAWRGWDEAAQVESFQELAQLIESAHLHCTDPANKEISFAVGVHACPYECGVMSVWVFLASFRPRPGRAPGPGGSLKRR